MSAHERPRTPGDEGRDGRIAWIEVVGYTAVILLIALVATGRFDVMLPWK